MTEEKTMVEIYHDDKRDLHYCKIMTNAKNLPKVLHEAIKKLKAEIDDTQLNKMEDKNGKR